MQVFQTFLFIVCIIFDVVVARALFSEPLALDAWVKIVIVWTLITTTFRIFPKKAESKIDELIKEVGIEKTLAHINGVLKQQNESKVLQGQAVEVVNK